MKLNIIQLKSRCISYPIYFKDNVNMNEAGADMFSKELVGQIKPYLND